MPLLLSAMPFRRFFALIAVVLAVAVATCSKSSGRDPRYPRRPPGCALSIHHGLPDVKVWDDIGVAQVDCYLDESEIACLGRLRTEACRMGGDILYNVPSKAARPVERGMVYRAQVAHTRAAKSKDEGPPPDAANGPVEPLPSAAGVPAPAAGDGGAGVAKP
jgi:hypothetical protein